MTHISTGTLSAILPKSRYQGPEPQAQTTPMTTIQGATRCPNVHPAPRIQGGLFSFVHMCVVTECFSRIRPNPP